MLNDLVLHPVCNLFIDIQVTTILISNSLDTTIFINLKKIDNL